MGGQDSGEGGGGERREGGWEGGGRGGGEEGGEGRGGRGDIPQELLRNNLLVEISILDFGPSIAMFMRYTKLSSNYQFLRT